MTDMKRITISVPDDVDAAVTELLKGDFSGSSYSQVIRYLVKQGLKREARNAAS